MIGAKVNGKLVTIDYVIQNGDRIEIITSQNSRGPSHDWLNIVKSTQAKTKINQWFRNELKEENIIHGKELVIAYCKSKGIDVSLVNKAAYQEKAIRKYGFHDWNSCLATIGHGGIKEASVVNKMYDEYCKDHPIPVTDEQVLQDIQNMGQDIRRTNKRSGIVVNGLYDVAAHFAKCCGPLPGDEICGFITRGRGITIHRTDCINMMHLSEADKNRLVDAEWYRGNGGEQELYMAEVCIYGMNRTGLVADISGALSARGIDINSINSRTGKQNNIASIYISLAIRGKEE